MLRQPITLLADQVAFIAAVHGPTNRPVQPLNDRTVRVSESAP